ncbi:KpsF/GutQ family sugar-phosphate isomerase [Sinorhizobium sp. 8-89]|uniref:KpsF/GutQ family sugar-phosphate isomerase n=1 Tax=Sinorhizobium sp. 7-81 TaxID=3049087 RepID=UPI0024C23334|nr:KpsF/GutQ family sugar-phosphate isomerase [Sinorhizobium sp. 7-81]MDK1389818.1 KpsF/GutQ family sugar-phosphate isomerase [Sinorhizobium sp. 7-81]
MKTNQETTGPESSEASARKMLSRAREFLRMEAEALHHLARTIDDQICTVANLILRSNGIVAVTGVGKSRLISEKISATLASTGTRSIPLNPTDALHGDLGRLRSEDILLCLSNSGETEELTRFVVAARPLGVTIVAMTGNAGSPLARMSDFVVDMGSMPEACPLGLAPTTTTTAQMALGDALALVMLEQRGLSSEDFARYHPAGSLGQRLLRVREVMRHDDRLPIVLEGTPIKLALLIMYTTPGRPGAVVVVDGHSSLLGVLTDRDLEPIIDQEDTIFSNPIESIMHRDPPTIAPEAPVHAALDLVQRTSREHLVIVDDLQHVVGLLAASDIPGFSCTSAGAKTRIPLAS